MDNEREKCPVCLSQNNQLLYALEQGKLRTCKNCELVFYTPRPTLEELDSFYNSQAYRDYYQKSAMTGQEFAENRYQQLSNLICRHAPYIFDVPNKKLLDIGCGEGHLLQVASQKGWEITGTELSPSAAIKANQTLGNKVMIGDILSLDLPANNYDMITLYHVIEHLIDPIPTLERIKQLLKPQGIAFIETPNIGSLGAKIRGQKWSHITPPEHITYFNPASLAYSLKQANFNSFYVFTNSPQSVESVKQWGAPLKSFVKIIYHFAPLLGLGAMLQAIAVK